MAVALFVITATVCLTCVTPGFDACRKAFGHDFLAFYSAGTLVREGRAAELYDLEAIRRLEREAARSAGFELGNSVGPWWNPPLFAWAFAPLAALSFPTALGIWTGINCAAAVAAAWLLARIAAPQNRADRALVILLILVSAPLLQSLTHGQNSAISLLLVAGIVTAWRRNASFVAGALVGGLAYKPQLAAALGVVLVLHRGRRAAGGMFAVGAGVLLLTFTTMPGALSDYVHRLPQNLHAVQVEQTYLWDRHVTLKAFWRLLLQGRDAGETSWVVSLLTALCALPLLAGLAVAALRSGGMGKAQPYPWEQQRDQDHGQRCALPMPPRTDAVIAAALAAAPLLMPFYFDYDLLLLAAAAVLANGISRRTFSIFAALYLWLFVNPYVAGAARVNLTVPLLFGVALALTDRALHGHVTAESVEVIDDAPPALARAA